MAVSLVIPAYDEEESIVKAVHEALAALSRLADQFEVLVVDDGSRDATASRVTEEFGGLDSVRLLRHRRNSGYGAALRTGFSAARFPLFAFTDADRQFHLDDLGLLLGALDGHDAACGYRLNRKDHWLRLVYSKIYNQVVRGLLGLDVRDCDCALKVFRRSALEGITIRTNGFVFNAELLARLSNRGASIVEVGVRHRHRRDGQSTVSPLHALPVVAELLRFWWSDHLFPQGGPRRSRASTAPESALPAHENSVSSEEIGSSRQAS